VVVQFGPKLTVVHRLVINLNNKLYQNPFIMNEVACYISKIEGATECWRNSPETLW